jgi:large subunit ribosomal protein L19
MSKALPLIQKIESEFHRKEALPDFRPGDRVRVHVRIREGEKERIQAFEGICIGRSRGDARETFTVRKVSYSVGVERVFPVNSPNVQSVELLSRGKVRQSRLYYLRGLSGKAARIKERAFEKPADDDNKEVKVKKRGAHRKAEAAKAAPAAPRKKARKPRTKKAPTAKSSS